MSVAAAATPDAASAAPAVSSTAVMVLNRPDLTMVDSRRQRDGVAAASCAVSSAMDSVVSFLLVAASDGAYARPAAKGFRNGTDVHHDVAVVEAAG
ncbi:hypothetical protein GCM10018954_047000 [Kutzneria kofuensis]